MIIVDHEHGGIKITRCQHPDCITAVRRWYKRWRYDNARGLMRLVDANPARMHVFSLIGRDWSLRSIAGAAGVSTTTLSYLTKDKLMIQRAISERILAVSPDQVPSTPSKQTGEPFVPKLGAARRVQALLWLGHGYQAQRLHGGVNTRMVIHQKGRWITRSTHDKIAALYDDLSSTEGTSKHAKAWARKQGYQPPAAWDDIDLDPNITLASEDPNIKDETEIDEAAVLRRMNGDKSVRLSLVDAAEIVRRCSALRWTFKEIEMFTGLKPERYREDRKKAS